MVIDPISFEVVKHRLWHINDEQGVAIRTISASPIVVEGNDFNVGLYTGDGELVVAGIGSTVHVSTTGMVIRNIMRLAGKICDGDVFMTNDPYLGTLHQNDVVMASPIFHGAQLVLWIANVLHHPDVGGIDEGSFCINARTVHQEAPRYFLKIIDQGVFSTEVERTFVSNSRLPETVSLDLRAQIGGIFASRKRLSELTEAYGIDTVVEVMKQSLVLSRQALARRLRELPDGVWETEAFMDGDRAGSDRLLRVALRMEKRADRLIFDYTGSAAQVDAPVNSPFYATYAASLVPIYSFLCGSDIDCNDGINALIEVVAPEGTVVNACHPAPVSACSVGFRWLTTTAATKAIADMLDCSRDYRDRACASWTVSNNNTNIFARLPSGKQVGAMLSEQRAGGAAARTFADGFDNAGFITAFASNIGNVESIEWKLPVLYLFRRRLIDSGGPGRFRGGLSALSALVPYGVESLVFKSTNTAGTDASNASGLDGGFPGAGSQTIVVRDVDVRDCIGQANVPEGRWECLPSKADGVVDSSDVFMFYPPGGGGFGDPLAREPFRVLDDVAEGRVSIPGARAFYGVVIGQDGEVDDRGTADLRDEMKRSRLSVSREDRLLVTAAGGVDRVGDSISVVDREGKRAYRCRVCGCHLGDVGDGVAVRRFEQPLGSAGPWLALRWRGDSPNFTLDLRCCPQCATLFQVREQLVARTAEPA